MDILELPYSVNYIGLHGVVYSEQQIELPKYTCINIDKTYLDS